MCLKPSFRTLRTTQNFNRIKEKIKDDDITGNTKKKNCVLVFMCINNCSQNAQVRWSQKDTKHVWNIMYIFTIHWSKYGLGKLPMQQVVDAHVHDESGMNLYRLRSSQGINLNNIFNLRFETSRNCLEVHAFIRG